MEALRIEGLSKDFGGVHALSDINFSVEVGERLAIIGPNGAGKTTLFNLLNGQLSASSGHINLFGQDITTMPTHSRAHRGQARTFQLTSLFLNLEVIRNVLLALNGIKPSRFNMFRPPTADEHLSTKAQELLESMDLWQFKDSLVKNLSYGAQRKLEIVLSLAMEPRLLLLDEPNNGLSTGEAAELINMILGIGSDITVVLVAHDMDLVFSLAKRIIVLHYGQVIADGTPEQVQANPKVNEIYMGIEDTN